MTATTPERVELVVVPLDEAGEPVGEGLFATDAGRPSASAVVARIELATSALCRSGDGASNGPIQTQFPRR